MSKLFQLKSWLTVKEAAEHLSLVFKEPVSVADVYRLCLDGHLTLSANFVNYARGQYGQMVGVDEAPFSIMPSFKTGGSMLGRGKEFNREIPKKGSIKEQIAWIEEHRDVIDSGEYILVPHGVYLEEKGMLVFKEDIVTIKDVWDLSMIGAEWLDVQHALLQEVDGPELTLTNLEGVVLISPDGSRYARLMEHYSENEYSKDGKDLEKYPRGAPSSYYPAGGIPSDAPFVVRTAAIAQFIESVSEPATKSKPMRADAVQSYERVIAALWVKAHAGGGPGKLPNEPYAAAQSLSKVLADNELESPSADKIGRMLASAKGRGVRIGT